MTRKSNPDNSTLFLLIAAGVAAWFIFGRSTTSAPAVASAIPATGIPLSTGPAIAVLPPSATPLIINGSPAPPGIAVQVEGGGGPGMMGIWR